MATAINGTVDIYTVEARAGRAATAYPHSDFQTDDYPDAQAYAQQHGLMVIVNHFAFEDSELLDDYTPEAGSG
jgi:hypothetical protein